MKKIIFLDIDGVVAVASSSWLVSTTLMNRLLEAVHLTGATVVVSSTWKEDTLEKTKSFMPDALKEVITDQTPDLNGRTALEIEDYLKEHPTEAFCILDDEPDRYPERLQPNLVATNPVMGLSDTDIIKIKKLLDSEAA